MHARTEQSNLLNAVIEASAIQTESDFPPAGDNFRTVGPWRILEGSGWRNWQIAALSAEIALSRCHGDEASAARQIAALRVRKTREVSAPDGAIRNQMPASAAPFAGRQGVSQQGTATLRDRTAS